MAARIRFGRFGFQVRLILVLLVLFLAALDLLNLYLLSQAKDALERTERLLAEARVVAMAEAAGHEVLAETAMARDTEPRLGASALRKLALRHGYDRVSVLDRAGREVVSSTRSVGTPGADYQALGEAGKAALSSGRPATRGMAPESGGTGARMTAFAPVMDSSGRMLGVVEAVRPVPTLGRAARNFRLVLAVQVVGVLVIAGVAFFFANWVSRPYRSIAAAVGEVGLTHAGTQDGDDPEDLAQAFRAVAEKLKEQEETLGALGTEGGGLGDLVRFANRAASTMTTGVMVLDRQARLAAINPAAAGMLGVPGREVRDEALRDFAPGAESLDALVRSCLEKGQAVSREVLEVRNAGGVRGHLGVSISPATGRDARTAGVLVLMTDLTEIRELQEQARLRESLASVGQISAGIAHELRNALGTILGYARMLEKREDPRVRGPALEILKEVDAVRSTVDEFLLYARPPEPSRTPVDLDAVVRSCAAAAHGSLEVVVSGEFDPVIGDESLLRRVFDNLLRNAADSAGEDRERVRVWIRGRKVASGRTLQVDVEDDGPGIPADLRDQVFVPFFTTRDRGTGLGLALVQRTVVDLGGSIEAGQGLGGGAVFRIRLPLAGD